MTGSATTFDPDLKDRNVLILGSGTWVDRALLREAESRGAKVLLSSAEATTEDEVERLGDEAVSALGTIDALVLPIVVSGDGTASTISHADWAEWVEGPLERAFLVCRRVISEMMLQDDGGSIVVLARLGTSPSAALAAAALENALLGLVRTIGKEYGKRSVRANLVIVSGSVPSDADAFARRIAASACFLVSSRASYVTGEVLRLSSTAQGAA